MGNEKISEQNSDLSKLGKYKDIKDEYSSTYWYEVKHEQKKEWWVKTKNDLDKLKLYLKSSGLQEEFELSNRTIVDLNKLNGKVLDVAAGVCWTSAFLSEYNKLTEIDALDFSWHRKNDIAPDIIKFCSNNPHKITKIFGSSYNAKAPQDNYNLVFMSQAFHHAKKHLKFLLECDKVLKKDGAIVNIGEHLVTPFKYFKRFIRNVIVKKSIIFNFYKLFPPDDVLGDHYYRISDYYFMFQSFGYSITHIKTNIRNSVIIVAIKK
jgi:ubiquinone/menaquinone biosynthesis C-methylase UbiE